MMNNVTEGAKQKASYANKRTTGKEQFYTQPAVVDLCMEIVNKHIDLADKTILEPAGGTGEFIEGFLRNGIAADRIVSCDIEPKHKMVSSGNFLEMELPGKGMVCITNPPFGRCNSLSKKFFEKATHNCDYICFLVPKSWEKWTVINSLNNNYHLLESVGLPRDCFYLPEGRKTKKGVLNTVFQIWERRVEKREKIKIPDNKVITKILPSTDDLIVRGANTSILVFGHSCGKVSKVDGNVKRKTTTMYLDIKDEKVLTALQNLNLERFFKRTAFVEALSIKEINYALNEELQLPNYVFENEIYR